MQDLIKKITQAERAGMWLKWKSACLTNMRLSSVPSKKINVMTTGPQQIDCLSDAWSCKKLR
jgi:hypothetical protein